jgi:hypothetical protein
VFRKGGRVDMCECGLDVGDGSGTGVGEKIRSDGRDGETRIAVEVEVELRGVWAKIVKEERRDAREIVSFEVEGDQIGEVRDQSREIAPCI